MRLTASKCWAITRSWLCWLGVRAVVSGPPRPCGRLCAIRKTRVCKWVVAGATKEDIWNNNYETKWALWRKEWMMVFSALIGYLVAGVVLGVTALFLWFVLGTMSI